MDDVVARLRAGDEAAFTRLVSEHHRGLVRLARTFVGSEAAAEEVTQETWVAVLDGIAGFEERSSLKTWIFRILVNRAKTRAKRQGREIPFDVQEDETHPDESRFSSGGFWGGPRPWTEADMDDKRVVAIVRRELDNLPEAHRAVVVMRDVEGLDAKDVCNVLAIQETHQRVLLHRARTKLRAVIEKELGKP